jgi:hypothetical protein
VNTMPSVAINHFVMILNCGGQSADLGGGEEEIAALESAVAWEKKRAVSKF